MFEYMYLRDFVPLILLWILLLFFGGTSKIKYMSIYATVFVIVFAFFGNLYFSNLYDRNIELFNKDKKLECFVGKTKYLVQKSNNYTIKKDYFVKDDRLILVVDCEEF